MEALQAIDLSTLLPLAAVVAGTVGLIWALNRQVFPRIGGVPENKLPRQLAVLAVAVTGVLLSILALPISAETKGQLLSLFGLALTALIAFSSTTLVTNAMAGLMLRAIGSFHAGDFIRSAEHFGRVTEQGLFHTEIQTGNRDLTSIPNAFLVNHPVTVVRRSGTIVETTLSLGYDVPHGQAEELLLKAAGSASLTEAFVQVLELGDYAVTYRVAGFLGETKRLVSAATVLRCAVLDTLHGAGVEIASPSLMAQRRLAPGEKLTPQVRVRGKARQSRAAGPEDLVFDKAEEAERIGKLRHELGELATQVAEWEKSRDATEEAARPALEARIEAARARMAEIEALLEQDAK